jgi:predicted nucleotide-binding protein
LATALAHYLDPECEDLNAPWSRYLLRRLVDVVTTEPPPCIFVIHGRSRDHEVLADFLRSDIGVPNVTVMGEAFQTGVTLPQKFSQLAKAADAAIAIATPDDVGGLRGGELNPRARQNLWFEIGWFWGRLGPSKVLLLVQGHDLEIPTDVSGLEYYSYSASILEQAGNIRKFVKNNTRILRRPDAAAS